MDNYIGEIRIFAGNFAPQDWQFCNGQLVNINDYQALYSLIGTTYGGDGQTTFGLPDMRSRAAVGMGPGPGLSNYQLGQLAGAENVTLTNNQLPAHQHPVQAAPRATTGSPAVGSPAGAYFGDQGGKVYAAGPGTTQLAAGSVVGQTAPTGGSQPHTNIQPYQAISYIISMGGIYPSQQ
ncbi:MAG: phage tail protein [Hymenobacter sp.]|nr:MAG: phage tail protein [Hymenobacter sp.]